VETPDAFYDHAAADADAAATRAAATSRRISWLRLLLLAAAGGVWWRWELLAPPVRASLLAGTIVLFVAAVAWHRRVRARLDAHRRRAAAARAGAARTRHRWDEMPPLQPIDVPEGWPRILARDLGVTGEQSLLRLLDVTHPARGGARLVDWLLGDPAPVATIRARQESVVALRDRPALLLEAAAETRHGRAPATGHALHAFRAWCDSDASPDARTLRTLSWLTGAASAIAFALLLVRRDDAASALALIAVFVNTMLAAYARRLLQQRVAGLDLVVAQLRGALRIMSLVAESGELRGALGTIQQRSRAEGANRAFASLIRLLDWNAVRHSPMAHWAFNGAAAFDVHLAAALARWHARNAHHAARWLDDVADAEALVALGTFAFDGIGHATPEITDDPAAPPLLATRLAHPLIAADVAVANDIALESAGDVVVVSGPNMAGKTTFLRAIGLDILLAQAGGLVRSEGMRLRRARLRTSVRVEDDLSRGVSLFMAELERLGSIVRDAAREDAPPVFFLLDEVLHGTNAPDRRAATRAILAALHRAGAAGLVTTHDPEIAPHGAGARQLHFDGEVVRDEGAPPTLRFDYVARPGPAEHTNALALLEMLGIPLER